MFQQLPNRFNGYHFVSPNSFFKNQIKNLQMISINFVSLTLRGHTPIDEL